MINIQSILQKVGFDVLGISTEYTLSENVLSFNPDVVVGFGRGGKVTSVGVGRRLREMTRWQGKVILVLPTGYKPQPQDFAKIRADMLLEAPVAPLQLMQTIGNMLGYDEAVLHERLAKHGTEVKADSEGNFIGGSVPGDDNQPVIVTGAVTAKEDPQLLKGQIEHEKTEIIKEKAALPENEPLVKKLGGSFEIAPEEDAKLKKRDEDLEALWQELTTHSELHITPEEEAAAKNKKTKRVSFELEERNKEFTEEELEEIAQKLQSAHNTEHERVSKYAKFTANVKDFDPRQSLSRIATRKAQKELAKSWKHPEIEDQDEARRNFTKALFRKK